MKVNLVHSDDCPHCSDLLAQLKEQGGLEGKEINFIKLESPEGQNIAAKAKLEEIPIALTEEGLKCEIHYLDDSVDVICPTKEGPSDAQTE